MAILITFGSPTVFLFIYIMLYLNVSSKISYVEILTPKDGDTGSGALGRCLSPEVRILIIRINVLKEDLRETLPLPPCEDVEKRCQLWTGRGPSSNVTALVPWSWIFQPPGLYVINFLCLKAVQLEIFCYSSPKGTKTHTLLAKDSKLVFL